jgi:hypothetical protein
MSLTNLNAIIYSWERAEARPAVLRALKAFAGAEGGGTPDGDDLSYVLTVAKHPKLAADPVMIAEVARVLRVCACRPCNATLPPEPIIRGATSLLDSALRAALPQVQTDACYVLLRFIGDERNLVAAIDAVCPLCVCLSSTDQKLQQVACACLQGLAQLSLAREQIQSAGGVESLIALLFSSSDAVVERALAALHAASADLQITGRIAFVGGVQVVLAICARRGLDVQALLHATGIVQNLTRDKDITELIEAAGAAAVLLPVLSESDDTTVQAAVVSAMLNLHSGNAESRTILKRVLADVIAEGLVASLSL